MSFLACCGWPVQALVVALSQIQVMLPQDSAQRQHDQQHTVFILSLPVVIAVVPAGSLPSALPLTELPVNATHSLCKNANKPWSPACCAGLGNTRGVQQRRVRFIIVLAFVTKTDTGWQLNRSCIYNYKWGSLFKFIIVTGFDPLACMLGFKLFCGSFPRIEHYISNWINIKLNQELDLEFESELNWNGRSHDSRKIKGEFKTSCPDFITVTIWQTSSNR